MEDIIILIDIFSPFRKLTKKSVKVIYIKISLIYIYIYIYIYI